jgi:hypothetical protein
VTTLHENTSGYAQIDKLRSVTLSIGLRHSFEDQANEILLSAHDAREPLDRGRGKKPG